MRKLITAAALGFIAIGQTVNASEIRMDIKTLGQGFELKNLNASEGTKAEYPTWIKDVSRHRLNASYRKSMSSPEWTTINCRFTPAADGKVKMTLQGKYSKADPKWILIDNVKVTGAKILNGDFEEGNHSKSRPMKWEFNKSENQTAEYVKGGAASGEYSIKVCQKWRATQEFTVKKDQEVVVILQGKLP